MRFKKYSNINNHSYLDYVNIYYDTLEDFSKEQMGTEIQSPMPIYIKPVGDVACSKSYTIR